jgi:hypothetical protein
MTAAWIFCANHEAGPTYTGPIAQFCCWCGERLVDGESGEATEEARKSLIEESPE